MAGKTLFMLEKLRKRPSPYERAAGQSPDGCGADQACSKAIPQSVRVGDDALIVPPLRKESGWSSPINLLFPPLRSRGDVGIAPYAWKRLWAARS